MENQLKFTIEKTTLLEYIKSPKFRDFQLEMILYNEDIRQYKDELYGEGDKFDEIYQLEDVFLLQKAFYEHTGVYLAFPIAGKFIYDEATRADCSWCSISSYKDFDFYLATLINEYEEEKRKDC